MKLTCSSVGWDFRGPSHRETTPASRRRHLGCLAACPAAPLPRCLAEPGAPLAAEQAGGSEAWRPGGKASPSPRLVRPRSRALHKRLHTARRERFGPPREALGKTQRLHGLVLAEARAECTLAGVLAVGMPACLAAWLPGCLAARLPGSLVAAPSCLLPVSLAACLPAWPPGWLDGELPA